MGVIDQGNSVAQTESNIATRLVTRSRLLREEQRVIGEPHQEANRSGLIQASTRPCRVKVFRSNSLSSFVHELSLAWHRAQTAR
jgi:hypothetical protein